MPVLSLWITTRERHKGNWTPSDCKWTFFYLHVRLKGTVACFLYL